MVQWEAPVSLHALTRKLAHLARVDPDAARGVELLVDDALARHQEQARAERLARFARLRRVK